MATSDDDRFKPKVGAPKNRVPATGKFLKQVLQGRSISSIRIGRTGTRPGARLGRGHTIAQFAGERLGLNSRRVVIKSRIVKLQAGKATSTVRHLRYVEREGISREGEQGVLYSASSGAVDGPEFDERCTNDRHQFRFIVSPEDAVEISDLKSFTRDLMGQMERDLETRLDWVAVDHWDTDNPHTHIVLRGKDEKGKDLIIASDYMAHGMRARGAELATEWLGPRTERDIAEALDRNVTQERWTALDRDLHTRARENVVNLEAAPAGFNETAHRARLLGRLQQLTSLGLATKLKPGVWALEPDAEATLRELGNRGDIIRTLHRVMGGVSREFSIPKAGLHQPIIGRIAGKGLADELHDVGYLVIDGTDGRAHYARLDAKAQLSNYPMGSIVEVRADAPSKADFTINRLTQGGIYDPARHLEIATSAEQNPKSFVEAHVRRLEALRRARVVNRLPDGRWRVPGDLEAQGRAYDRSRSDGFTVDVRSYLPLSQQTRAIGATWLDSQLLSPTDLSAGGFSVDVKSALNSREEYLLEQGLARRQGQRLVVISDLLSTLRNREIKQVASDIQAQSGLLHREAVDGVRVSGVYRRSLLLASGRFALIEDSTGFSLVPFIDRRSASGKRDYAVLMLFATYGLRSQEVAALELSAIDWPQSRFHVLGRKAGNSTTYPLAVERVLASRPRSSRKCSRKPGARSCSGQG